MTWKKEEVEYLKNNFPSLSDNKISKNIHKSSNALRIKASRLGLKKESSIYRNNLELNEIEEQVVVGGLLGDSYCHIKRPKSVNANLEWAHGSNQIDYAYWKSELLNRLKFNVRNTKLNTLHFTSKNYKCLNDYHQLFYPNGKKVVNQQILDKIDKLGLLIWYLDDGSYHKRDKTISLYTNCFSLFEQNEMKEWFKTKWGITCNIHRVKENQYCLYFPVKETKKLILLFKEFNIPDCMKYKILFN
jgi:hypothetical protein